MRITGPGGDLLLEILRTAGAIPGGEMVPAAALRTAIGAIAAGVARAKLAGLGEAGHGPQR